VYRIANHVNHKELVIHVQTQQIEIWLLVYVYQDIMRILYLLLVLVYIVNILACDYRCASCSYDSTNLANTLGICSECKYGFDINNACKTCMYTYQFENTPAITCDSNIF